MGEWEMTTYTHADESVMQRVVCGLRWLAAKGRMRVVDDLARTAQVILQQLIPASVLTALDCGVPTSACATWATDQTVAL